MKMKLFRRTGVVCACLVAAALGALPATEPDESSGENDPQPESEVEALYSGFEEQVVVSASRVETKVLETPQAVTVITSEQLERRRGETFADIFSTVPGLQGARYGSREFQFNLRGAPQNGTPYVLVLVDGQPIYEDLFGLVVWDTVPISMEEVERIEIIRGPASAAWGPNAMNGVINFIRKSPSDLAGNSFLRLGGGENDILSGGFVTAGESEQWAWKFSANHYSEDAGDRDEGILSDGRALPDFPYEDSEQTKFDFQLDHTDQAGGVLTFGLGGIKYDGNSFGVDGPYQFADDAEKAYARLVYKRNRTTYQLYVNQSESELLNLFTGAALDTESRAYDGHVVSERFFGNRRLIFGGNFKLNEFDLTTVPNEDSRMEGGVFLENEWFFDGGHTLSLGARLDWNEEYGTEISPKFGYVAKLATGQALRFSASRSFRAPTPPLNYWYAPFQLSFDFGPPIGVITWDAATVGNPDLEVEQMTAFEVGWTGVWSDRLMMTVSLFRNEQEDYYASGPTAFHDDANPPPGWPAGVPVPPGVFLTEYSFFNVGKSEQIGTEVTADVNWTDNLSSQFHWTWLDLPDVSGDGSEALLLNIPPRNRLGATLAWQGEHWAASLEFYHQSKAYWADVLGSDFADWTDSFESWSGSLAYFFPGDKLGLKVRASNILDDEYKHHVWGDVMSRRVSAELTYRF